MFFFHKFYFIFPLSIYLFVVTSKLLNKLRSLNMKRWFCFHLHVFLMLVPNTEWQGESVEPEKDGAVVKVDDLLLS